MDPQTEDNGQDLSRKAEDLLAGEESVLVGTSMGDVRLVSEQTKGGGDSVEQGLGMLRKLWKAQGQMGEHARPARMSASQDEVQGCASGLGFGDLCDSDESTRDTNEAIERARAAFHRTLEREGKLRK